jgi:hypothetical protein
MVRFWISVIQEKSPTTSRVTIVVGFGWEIWREKFLIAVGGRRGRPIDIRSLSVSTGFGSEGVWKIYVGENPLRDQPVVPAVSHSDIESDKKNEMKRDDEIFKHRPVQRRLPMTPIRETLVANHLVDSSTGGLLKRPRESCESADFAKKSKAIKR